MFTRIKTSREIDAMRASGKILATIMTNLLTTAEAGISTLELADMAAQQLKGFGAKPAFLGYDGPVNAFPHVLCTSVNEQVVHGIPSKSAVLADGDVLSMDFGVIYDGMISDSAATIIIGHSSKQVQQLVTDTNAALYKGIETLKDGTRTGDIGHTIETFLGKKYGIVRDLVGHGVGHELHEEPNIPNYGRKGTGHVLKEGMTIAIEPMVTLGTDRVIMENDGWTISTADNSLSAHFEHTILITKSGFEILTARD